METEPAKAKRPTAARSYIGTLNNPAEEPEGYLTNAFNSGKFSYVGG